MAELNRPPVLNLRAGLALFVGVLGLGAVAWVGDQLGARLGTLADWLAAGGTIAAFGATYLLLRHELDARRSDELGRRRLQASSVMFTRWTVGPADPGDQCLVTNLSAQPIRAVRIVSWRDDGFDDGASGSPPGSIAQWEPVTVGIVEPGPESRVQVEVMVPPRDGVAVKMAAVFVDAGERLWRRWEDGVLEDLTASGQPMNVRSVVTRPTAPPG